ncbi:hypothetical protein Tco_0797288 [Tanacetum coccineum]
MKMNGTTNRRNDVMDVSSTELGINQEHGRVFCRLLARLGRLIGQIQSGSSNTSEGSKNNGSFEDSGRLDEEGYKDKASSEDGGLKNPHVQRSNRESRAPIRDQEAQEAIVLRIRDERLRLRKADSRHETAKVPYALADGSVIHTRVCRRPYIAHPVGVLSRFRSNPGREHYEAVKWLLRYKKVGGTKVSWMSRFQKSVAMSTIKAEYMAIVEAGKELHVSYVRQYRRLALALLKGRWFEVYKRLVETESIDVISLQVGDC